MKILDVPQSGSVGAVTSSRNSSGQYRRQRSMPVQPRTPSQVTARSRLSDEAAAWRGLTDTQRASWDGFGQSFTLNNSLGTSIHLTGFQCFIKVNCTLLCIASAAVLVPPALPTFVACTVTAITAAAGTPALTIAGTTPTGSVTHMIFASPQLSAGVSFCGNFRYLANVTTYAAGTYSLLTAYTAKFGTLAATKRIFVKVVQQLAGMQDNGTTFQCIVAA